MKFGVDNSAFAETEKGRLVQNPKPLLNDLVIQPVPIGDTYTFVGIDGNIAYDGPLNEEKSTKEYLNRSKKVWLSELPNYNNFGAHNSFATPIITPTVGIID